MLSEKYIRGISDITRDRSLKLYDLLVSNRYSDYKSFLNILKSEFKDESIKDEIKTYIKYTKYSISVTRAHEMVTILKYMIAKSNCDINTMRLLKEDVDKIGINHLKNNSDIALFKVSQKHLQEKKENHKVLLEKINNDIETTVNTKKNIHDLQKEGKIKNSNLLLNLKKNINDIGIDKFVEFLKANYGLQEVSNKDLEQFKSVIEFFINNLSKNIELFKNYKLPQDNQKVLDVYVNGEDDLGHTYKKCINKLYSWKVKKMESLLIKYKKLLKNIDDFSKNNVNLKRLDESTLIILKRDEEIAFDFYRNILDIINVYNMHIKNNNIISDDLKNKLSDEYIKTLMPRK